MKFEIETNMQTKSTQVKQKQQFSQNRALSVLHD